MQFFYGTPEHLWFRCVLEFDMVFNCLWANDFSPTRAIEWSQEFSLRKAKVIQEIVILRSILNLPISAPTYSVNYSGWNYALFSTDVIDYLPWRRLPSFAPEAIKSKELYKYKRYRRTFLDIKNKEMQQQIFMAMRKLAFSFDKPYGGDEIMDTASGLEGLLVNSKNEVGNKFAERVAILLENDPKKRAILRDDMEEAYNLRSAVAHGAVIIDGLDSVISDTPVQKPRRKNRKRDREV